MARKKKQEDIDIQDNYDLYDDDEEKDDPRDLLESDEEEYDEEEITDEQLALASGLDIEFDNEEDDDIPNHKRVFNASSKSEQIRQRFFSICEKYNSGDEVLKKQSLEEAVDELQNFVHYIIKKKYATYTKYYEDLVQEGIVGILKGMEKYDPAKSLPTTYFNLFIIHEISKYIDTEVNKTTSHYSSNLTKINRVIEKLEQAGKKWTITDIAVETGLNMETVIQCLNIKEYKNEMYYDAEDATELNIKDNKLSPEQEVIEKEKTEILYDAINSLLPEEKQVLVYRYGLGDTKVISYKEIAKIMNISIEKVRKYRHDAIRKLKYKTSIRNTFRDYVNEDEEKILNSTQIALVQEDLANSMLNEIEELDLDFDELWNDD